MPFTSPIHDAWSLHVAIKKEQTQCPGKDKDILKRHLCLSVWLSDYWNNGPHKARISPPQPSGASCWERKKPNTHPHTHTHSHTESARKEIARLLIKEMVMGPWWAEPFLARTAYMFISLTLCLNFDSTPEPWIERRWHELEYHPVFVPIPSVANEWISLFSFSLLIWLFKIGLWKMGGWTWLVRVTGCES